MTDGNGARWYTLGEAAALLSRARRTVRRLARPYRAQCQLRRCGRHPRKLLWLPEPVVTALAARLVKPNLSPH